MSSRASVALLVRGLEPRIGLLFAGVRFSPSGLPSSTFFERIDLPADATAANSAVPNDHQLNESSLSDARPTPPTMGSMLR